MKPTGPSTRPLLALAFLLLCSGVVAVGWTIAAPRTSGAFGRRGLAALVLFAASGLAIALADTARDRRKR